MSRVYTHRAQINERNQTKNCRKIEHTERKKITTRLEFTWLQDRRTDAEVSYPKKAVQLSQI